MKMFQAVTLAVALLLASQLAMAQSIDEPRFVNRMLGDITTPAITPGEEGIFSLTVNNPDPVNITGPMENVSLLISIYQYSTLEESVPISEITSPPVFGESGTEATVDCGDIPAGGNYPVSLTIQTEKSTPHGAYFSQSSYFVMFRLAFAYQNVNYTMASRGHFTDEQWELLQSGDTGAGEINQTYLEELGFDGIIPDSAFSVRKNIPLWPAYFLIAFTVLSGIMAFASHVLDHPGTYPKLEKRFLRLHGRIHFWRKGITRRGKQEK